MAAPTITTPSATELSSRSTMSCGIWIDKDSEDDNPCGNNIVLFVFFSPANPDASKEEIQEALRKIKAIAHIK